MKKIIFLFLISFSVLNAQENRYEEIHALKTAFITKKLNFTSSEAEKFWPIYNNFEQQFHELRKKKRNEVYIELRKNWEELTDSDANRLMDKYLQLKFENLQLFEKRTTALKKVLSPKKIFILNKVEEDFKKELLDRYRKNKSEN